jgi:hypothetical protein
MRRKKLKGNTEGVLFQWEKVPLLSCALMAQRIAQLVDVILIFSFTFASILFLHAKNIFKKWNNTPLILKLLGAV